MHTYAYLIHTLSNESCLKQKVSATDASPVDLPDCVVSSTVRFPWIRKDGKKTLSIRPCKKKKKRVFYVAAADPMVVLSQALADVSEHEEGRFWDFFFSSESSKPLTGFHCLKCESMMAAES